MLFVFEGRKENIKKNDRYIRRGETGRFVRVFFFFFFSVASWFSQCTQGF